MVYYYKYYEYYEYYEYNEYNEYWDELLHSTLFFFPLFFFMIKLKQWTACCVPNTIC